MPAPKKGAAQSAAPDDLAGKRSALTAVQNETAAESTVDEDGSLLVTLTTRLGFHDMRVPPMEAWTSSARHALNRVPSDDLTWAMRTLPSGDAMKWMQLDPTTKDVNAFFDEWGRLLGQSLPQ